MPFRRLSERPSATWSRSGRRGSRRARRRRSRGSPPGGSTGGAAARSRRGRARAALLERARAVYTEPDFEPADARQRSLLDDARAAGRGGEGARRGGARGLELTAREASSGCGAAQRGAEREELLASLEELASGTAISSWSRPARRRPPSHADRLAQLRDDATRERAVGAERAGRARARDVAALEEFNLAPQLALESLFIRLRRAFSVALAA